MASNPMQRKARNSFLLGMLLMLVITGIIIAFLFLQIKNYRDKEALEIANRVNIAVLSQDVKSGQIITEDMLTTRQVNKNMIPDNAIGDVATLSNYYLEDKEGNEIKTKYENNVAILYVTKDEREYKVNQEDTGNYYIEKNGNKEYLELNSIPVVAKVSMNKNSVLTRELVSKGNNTTSDDVRKQEYNMLVLPTQLQTGEYIDVRLSMPSGEDYIVIAKKEVEIPFVDGADSADTIWINLTEAEILAMNSAIVEAFKIEGSKLYVTTYTEPGIQKAATPTYVISREVYQLIDSNPNIVNEAKNELYARYNDTQRNAINQQLQNNLETSDDNLKSKVQESITKTQDERKQYLDAMSATKTEQ